MNAVYFTTYLVYVSHDKKSPLTSNESKKLEQSYQVVTQRDFLEQSKKKKHALSSLIDPGWINMCLKNEYNASEIYVK